MCVDLTGDCAVTAADVAAAAQMAAAATYGKPCEQFCDITEVVALAGSLPQCAGLNTCQTCAALSPGQPMLLGGWSIALVNQVGPWLTLHLQHVSGWTGVVFGAAGEVLTTGGPYTGQLILSIKAGANATVCAAVPEK